MQNDNSIPLYPFNGRSLNLIDKFYIFGYNYSTLQRFLTEDNPKISINNLNEEGLGTFKIDEEPSTLNEITHDFKKQIVGPETIKKLIFPNSLYFYYRIETNNNIIYPNTESEKGYFSKIDFEEDTKICHKNFRSVFSCTPLVGTNSRKCQNGFAYTFYSRFYSKKKVEGIENKKVIYYVPYTFCIISEFPYYNSFEALFLSIRKMFSQQSIYIPIEILLYKIILLTPSPINTDVFIDLDLMCDQEKIYSQNKDLEDPASKTVSYNFKKNFINLNLQNDKSDKENFIIIEDQDNPKNQIIPADPDEIKIKFKYLSGYPLIQYNLAKVLFHSLSIENIINIFLFIFLENNVIFFSENNELLTLTINAYANFNFPLNDADYFYNVGAISLEKFQDNDLFGIKALASIIAINHKFVENYLSKANNIGEHIIVDLDNQAVLFAEDEGNKDQKISFVEINELIKNICEENPEYEYLSGAKIYKAINTLYKLLKEIKEKFNKKEQLFANNKTSEYNKFIGFNDEPYKDSIDELNKLIQKAFYDCLMTLSLYYYENFLVLEDNNQNMKIEFNNNFAQNQYYKKEEIEILKELKKTMKFGGSFSQFVMEHNPIDLFKIPLTFTDEFLSVLSMKKSDKKNSKIKYFELIDKLYLDKKSKDIITIDFSSDLGKYITNYKKVFDREIQENDKNLFNNDNSTLIKISEYKKVLKYQTYELDERILFKYIHMINNLTKEKYKEIITDISLKEGNLIKNISITEIESTIEQYFARNKYISLTELCYSNILILFAISLKYFPEDFDVNIYLSYLLQVINPLRKFIYLIIRVICKLYMKFLEENNYRTAKKIRLCFYSCFNYIRQKNIVPNENLMLEINQFFETDRAYNEENQMGLENNQINQEVIPELTEDNLIIVYNFTSHGFYPEKIIVKSVNEKERGFFNVGESVDLEILSPKIRYVQRNEKYIDSIFVCQKELYSILIKEYNKYIQNLDLDKLDMTNMFESVVNIIIFIRNSKKVEQFDDMMKIMENIFYIYYKKYSKLLFNNN